MPEKMISKEKVAEILKKYAEIKKYTETLGITEEPDCFTAEYCV